MPEIETKQVFNPEFLKDLPNDYKIAFNDFGLYIQDLIATDATDFIPRIITILTEILSLLLFSKHDFFDSVESLINGYIKLKNIDIKIKELRKEREEILKTLK